MPRSHRRTPRSHRLGPRPGLAQVFSLFHDMVFMYPGGHVVYFGPFDFVEPYFLSNGFTVPRTENPADYYIDVISGHVPHISDETWHAFDLVDSWNQVRVHPRPERPSAGRGTPALALPPLAPAPYGRPLWTPHRTSVVCSRRWGPWASSPPDHTTPREGGVNLPGTAFRDSPACFKDGSTLDVANRTPAASESPPPYTPLAVRRIPGAGASARLG
eukprot:1194298-Prorocentrum_minimum.AAC.4